MHQYNLLGIIRRGERRVARNQIGLLNIIGRTTVRPYMEITNICPCPSLMDCQ